MPGIAKFQNVPAVARAPEKAYPYSIRHMRESANSKGLREEGANLDDANMMGAPDVAALLGFLVRLTGAKTVVEVGVFRGSTTLWLAEALPADGRVIGLDIEASYADPARKYWEAANVSSKIDFRVGAARETMQRMIDDEGLEQKVDLVFIDADKPNYGHYYDLAIRLLKPNGIVAVDNTLWSARVCTVDPSEMDSCTKAIAELNERITADDRVDAVLLPLADGLTLARKR